jgi:DNA-binding MarR family transcriptional regulator
MSVKRVARTAPPRARGSRAADRSAATAPRLTYLVKQVQEALLARLDEITRQFGLTAKQYTALSVVQQYPGLSSAALGRLTFVTSQAANEMVTTLARKRFLTRSVDQANRRRLEVQLSRAGTRALAQLDALVDQLELEVFGGIGSADQARLRHMLHTCLESLSRPEARH